MRKYLTVVAAGLTILGVGPLAFGMTPGQYLELMSRAGNAIVSAASQIIPTGSKNPYTLGSLTSPKNYQIPGGHLGAWLPFQAAQSTDSAGGTFYPSGQSVTSYLTFEIPRDATMIELGLGNNYSSPVTMLNAAAWGSSQWAPLGYAGVKEGITPYDDTGSAVTTMPVFSWGNNGVDTLPNAGTWTEIPPNSTNLTTTASTATNSQTLTFGASITCPANGSTAVVVGSTSTSNPVLRAQTTVTGCTSSTTSTITISQFPRATVPASTTVYFMPPGFTLPVSTTLPLPSLSWSDWLPITTYQRIDGPVMAGQSIVYNGALIGQTVSSTTPTAAVMSGNLTQDIPAGSSLLACYGSTLNAALSPNYTLQFAANANIQPGMVFRPSGFSDPPAGWTPNTVQSVATSTNTVVTASVPIDPNIGQNTENWGSGSSFTFEQSHVVAVAATSGANTITLDSVSNLSVGMSAYSGTGTAVVSGTISAINGNVVTVTGTTAIALPVGMPITWYFTATTNAATTTSGSSLPFGAVPQNWLPGQIAWGAGIPANDTTWTRNTVGINLSYSVTSALTSGQTIYTCNPVTTSTDSPPGQNLINFASTLWPNYLVTVRIQYASNGVNFWASNGNFWANAFGTIPGTPQRFVAGQCAAGTDGVLTPTNISNTAGTCNANNEWVPIYVVKYYSPTRGINLLQVGDSHEAGDYTLTSASNFTARTALALSTPTTPMSAINAAWGGQPSQTYGPKAMSLITAIQPEVVVIPVSSTNDGSGAQVFANQTATANQIANYVRSYGGLPVLISDYQHQLYGCDQQVSNATFAAAIAYQKTTYPKLVAEGAGGTPVLNTASILQDPVQGIDYFNSGNFAPGLPISIECGHAADGGHALLSLYEQALLKPYLRY